MKKRYRTILAMIVTMLCALLILVGGYAGIALGGEGMLKISQEPEKITMSEDISNLFYSRIEDDVQLRPWNYDTEENAADGSISAENELFDKAESLYALISVAAGVEMQEVIRWYNSQDKTILNEMVTRYVENEDAYYFFYDDVIRLNGREYHVKICTDREMIYSFSCLRPKEENVRDSERWGDNKEQLSSLLKQYEETMGFVYGEMEAMRWERDIQDWWWDVELYVWLNTCFFEVEDSEKGVNHFYGIEEAVDEVRFVVEGEKEKYGIVDSVDIGTDESSDFKMQMVELDDCILLMSEEYQTQAIYYDVMEQKVVGFHFFY